MASGTERRCTPPSCVGCPLPWRSSTIGVQATASCRQRRAAEIKRTAGETAKEKFQQTNSGGGPCLHAEASGERRTHTGDVSPAPRSSCSRSFWSAAKRAADKRAADTRDAANRRRTTRGARRSGSANQGAQTERHRPRRRGMNRLAGEPDRTRCVAPRTSDPRRGRPQAGGGARQTVGSNHGFRASASASTPAKTRGGGFRLLLSRYPRNRHRSRPSMHRSADASRNDESKAFRRRPRRVVIVRRPMSLSAARLLRCR